MKILFLNTNIGYGGASKIMVWVANVCAHANHDVTFLTYRDDNCRQKLNPSVNSVHIQLEDLSGRGKGLFHTVKVLRRYIRENHFDIAIGFLPPSQLRLALACKGVKCKTLFSHRGDPFQSSKGIKNKIINYIAYKAFCSADAFVFQTQMAANYYSKDIRKKSEVICNPIYPLVRTIAREGNVTKDIVCVARLDIKQKRQDLLIRAFDIISSKYPEYKLKLYGDGYEYDEKILREKARDNNNVCFMGATNDVASAIQNAAMLVLSSDYEGIPNALLEAMSIGVPCISTDCSPGGAAMLIQNKKNGLLVPRNDVLSLADAMEYMISHPSEAELMGQRGMYVCESFSEEVIAKKWLSFIDKQI